MIGYNLSINIAAKKKYDKLNNTTQIVEKNQIEYIILYADL
jgi:hypothetical protein